MGLLLHDWLYLDFKLLDLDIKVHYFFIFVEKIETTVDLRLI